ncbi:TPA: hypothetical protein ON424_001065 [Morganella morganii]|nr:hypothetical protein [Morganella morganii]
MPTPCYISIEGKTHGNITAGAFTAESVGNIYDYTQLIEVSLSYRKIDREHTVAGTSGSDDWRALIEA